MKEDIEIKITGKLERFLGSNTKGLYFKIHQASITSNNNSGVYHLGSGTVCFLGTEIIKALSVVKYNEGKQQLIPK